MELHFYPVGALLQYTRWLQPNFIKFPGGLGRRGRRTLVNAIKHTTN